MIFGEICTEIIGHYNLEQGNLSKWSYMLHVNGEAVGSLPLWCPLESPGYTDMKLKLRLSGL